MIKRKKELQRIDFDGLMIFDYTAEMVSSSSSFASIDVPSKCRHKTTYSNRSDKYYYVVSGKVCFTIEGSVYELKEGDFCFIEKGKRFSYINDSDNIARLVLVHTPHFNLDDECFIK